MELKLTMDHPTYGENEAYVMGLTCASLKMGSAPKYLRIRECVRRQIKGKGDWYLDIAKTVQSEMIAEILDAKMSFTDEFMSRPTTIKVGSSGNYMGKEDGNGNVYVSYFQVFVPVEQFYVLKPIAQLRRKWVNYTRQTGRTLPMGVAAYRKQCIADGTAARMIADFGLPQELIDKLPTTYKSSNTDETL